MKKDNWTIVDSSVQIYGVKMQDSVMGYAISTPGREYIPYQTITTTNITMDTYPSSQKKTKKAYVPKLIFLNKR